MAKDMDGFVWRAERPDMPTFVEQKWGYRADNPGGCLTWACRWMPSCCSFPADATVSSCNAHNYLQYMMCCRAHRLLGGAGVQH